MALFGFSTLSLPDHAPGSAIRVLREIGYRAFLLRLDDKALDLRGSNPIAQYQFERVTEQIVGDTSLLIDTDGRYLLDSLKEESPSLIDPDGHQRMDMIRDVLEAVSERHHVTVMFSSGRNDKESSTENILERLSERITELLSYAAPRTTLAILPRKNHAIESVAHFERLRQWLAPSCTLQLVANIDTMAANSEWPVGQILRRQKPYLSAVLLGSRQGVDRTVIVESLVKEGFEGPFIMSCAPGSGSPITQANSLLQEMLRGIEES